MTAPHPARILFVEKVFMKRRKDVPLRGVELFNIRLVRDLAALGHRVVVPVVPSWLPVMRDCFHDGGPVITRCSDTGVDALSMLLLAVRARRADVLLLGNVGKSLLPMLAVMRVLGRFRRCVLMAHRESMPAFTAAMRRMPGHIVAVNETIARPFREAGHPSVHVDYGVTEAERYVPATAGRPSGAPVRFCVFGVLDNAWKGADTAMAAFRGMAPDIRRRCELHLASFADPPGVDEKGIVTYRWVENERVPEFLRDMDVMLVPSRDEGVMRETFSQVMVQGMLTGLPILANDLPILSEKLDQGGGLVFRSVEELTGSMERLAEDRTLRAQMGSAARRTALERYVWDTGRFCRRYLDEVCGE